jgi:hypothetical protein
MIKALLLESNGKRGKLVIGLALIASFSFALVICSFFVAGTANAGFNIVLTSSLNVGFVVGGYHVLKNSKTPIALGFLIGCASGLSLLNFVNGVYWGQLSHCTILVGAGAGSSGLSQYSCSNPTAYGAVSAFSVLLFVSQAAMAGFLVVWRAALINHGDDGNHDDAMPHGHGHGHGHLGSASYDDYKVSSSFAHAHATPSADL